MKEKESFLDRTRRMITEVRGLSDEELRKRLVELNRQREKPVKVLESTWGEDALYEDVLLVLGAQRGLWDQAGYPLERRGQIDFEYSRKIEKEFLVMMEERFPLLVFFLLDLKQNISKIDDLALTLIERAVRRGEWRFETENAVLVWRLKTIGLAARLVLSDRGYQMDEVK